MDNITSRVSSSETKIENITKITQNSEGVNYLYLEKALEQDALEYHLKGNNLQKVSIEYNLITDKDYQQVFQRVDIIILWAKDL